MVSQREIIVFIEFLSILPSAFTVENFPIILPFTVNLPPVYSSVLQPVPSIQQPFVGFPTSPFASYFQQLVYSSDVLPKLFEVNFTPSDASRIFFTSANTFGRNLQIPDIQTKSEIVSHAAERAFQNIRPTSLLEVTSNTAERYLLETGVLTPNNTRSLVEAYVKALEDAAKTVPPGTGPDYFATIRVLGVSNVIKTLGQSPDVLSDVIYLFADELNKVSASAGNAYP